MEVGKSSQVNSKKSSFTQTSCVGEESHLGEDSQLEYLSAYEEYADDKNSSSEFSEQREVGKVEDIPLILDKVPPQITAGQEEVSGKSNRHIDSTSGKQEDPFLSPGERAPAGALQVCTATESSGFYTCKKPGVCTPSTGSLGSTARAAKPQLPAFEILPSKNPGFGMEVADGASSSCVKSEPHETLTSASVSALPRAVDGSSDFPACFTTSTSSSAQADLCSRAINTEITMMHKSRPMGWPRQPCVDTASNTEWSFGAQSSHIQEQWELKNQLCTCDWKSNADRPVRVDKQTVKDCVSSCCQNTLQRATEAELQLLAIHHNMCYQHCVAVYELALEESSCFGRVDENAELYSSLLLVLEELENNYNNMRMKINMGTPLNELPPLSVEVKLPPISSFYVPYKLLRRCLCSDGLSAEEKADFEASKLQEKETCVTVDKSQTDGQPSDSAPQTGEEQCKDQDLKCGRMKTEEGTESWFDAKEELTLSDFSLIPEETKKQHEKQDMSDLREVKSMEKGNEGVPGGGPSSSVPEDTGENSLQKTSPLFSVTSSDIFESPYALNLSSFTKLIKKLQARHPEASRDKIVEALQQVRENNNGMLCGLSISTIEERASAILRKSMPSSGQEKQ